MTENISFEKLAANPAEQEVDDIHSLTSHLVGDSVERCTVQENLTDILENDSQFLFVARSSGERIVGMLIVTRKTLPHQKTAYADSIVVHPEFKRRGIATKLWGLATDYADKQEVLLQGSTSPKREAALELHAGVGFEPWDSQFLVRRPRADRQASSG